MSTLLIHDAKQAFQALTPEAVQDPDNERAERARSDLPNPQNHLDNVARIGCETVLNRRFVVNYVKINS